VICGDLDASLAVREILFHTANLTDIGGTRKPNSNGFAFGFGYQELEIPRYSCLKPSLQHTLCNPFNGTHPDTTVLVKMLLTAMCSTFFFGCYSETEDFSV